MFDMNSIHEQAALAVQMMTPQEQQRARRHRLYTLEWSIASMAVGTSRVRQFFQVGGEFDFWLLAMVVASGGGMATIDATIAKRPVFDRETHMANVLPDNAVAGMVLPVPEKVPASAYVEVFLTNISGAAWPAITRIAAHGIAVFRS